MKNSIADEDTIKFYAKEFHLIFRQHSRNQITNMVIYAINFCECFDDTEKEVEELKVILYDPIGYILKDKKQNFAYWISEKRRRRLDLRKSLGQLEWIDFRDSLFRTSLKKRYYVDDHRPKRTRFLCNADIKDFNLFLKVAVTNIFGAVRKKNNVMLAFDFSDVPINPIKQVGSEVV